MKPIHMIIKKKKKSCRLLVRAVVPDVAVYQHHVHEQEQQFHKHGAHGQLSIFQQVLGM